MFSVSSGVGTTTVNYNGGVQLFGMSGSASALFITLLFIALTAIGIFCLVRRHDKKAKKGHKPGKVRELLQRAKDVRDATPGDLESGELSHAEAEVEELEALGEADGTIELLRRPLTRRNLDLEFWHEDETSRGWHHGRGGTALTHSLVYGMARLERAVTLNTRALEMESSTTSLSTSCQPIPGGEGGQDTGRSATCQRGPELRAEDKRREDASTFMGAYAIDAGAKAVIPWISGEGTIRRGSSPGPTAVPIPLWNMVQDRLD
ncbi:MAG: hypothetical protein AAFR83_25040 [Cyanobacteria bacterium J06629_18]